MLVVNSEQTFGNNPVLNYLPKRIRKYMYFADPEELEEIRLRPGLPVVLQYRSDAFFLNDAGKTVLFGDNLIKATKQDINDALELISHSSLYAHENDLKNGYITIPGGCRVGITGYGVQNSGKITSIKDISGLNYRIPHEVSGCADRLMDIISDGCKILSTLIISPPECGKTTLLRDIIRNISYRRIKVSLVDERGEIASSANGYSAFDLGYFCDTMSNVPKDRGMLMMLRSMSPQVIATDELGGEEDIDAVKEIINAGVSLIATIHGTDEKQLRNRERISPVLDFFDCFIVLSRRFGVGTIEEAYRVD